MVNSADPDQMPHSVASHLDLHCLLFPICRTLSINGLKVQHVTLVVLVGWIVTHENTLLLQNGIAGSKFQTVSLVKNATTMANCAYQDEIWVYICMLIPICRTPGIIELKLKHATLVVLMIRIQENRHSLFCFMFNR